MSESGPSPFGKSQPPTPPHPAHQRPSVARSPYQQRPQPQMLERAEESPVEIVVPTGRLRSPKAIPLPDTMVTQSSRQASGESLHRHSLHPAQYLPGDLHPNPNSSLNPNPEREQDPLHGDEIDAGAELHEEHSCPECGSPVDANAHFCPACGNGLDDRGPANQEPEPDDRKHWRCDNCGSEITSQGSDRTLHCPFCESDYVAEIDPKASGRQRPEFIIGFAIAREEAAARVTQWLKTTAWYQPKDLINARVVEQLKGVYVPFWSFSTLANSVWTASIGEYWYRTETYTVRVNGKTQTRTRRVRHTEWWPLSGRHHQYYSGYLVSGSHGLTQQEADSLCPFNLPALQRYQPYFLAGWFAEEYSVDRTTAMNRSLQQFTQWEKGNVHAFMPGDTVSQLSVQTSFSQTQSDLCLLPIYTMTYVYRQQRFRVLVNGQTGKIIGQKPIWRERITWVVAWVIGLLLLIGAIALVMQIR